MNREYWNGNVQIGILVIHRLVNGIVEALPLVAENLQGNRTITECVAPQELNASDEESK